MIDEYDVICIENLNIQDMRRKDKNKSKNLRKGINDVAWNEFTRCLVYKAEDADKQVVLVNPAYTSSMCSECGLIKQMPLWKREYDCETCGHTQDRDLNAANNIKRLGMQSLALLEA